jgi:hypothetical protein
MRVAFVRDQRAKSLHTVFVDGKKVGRARLSSHEWIFTGDKDANLDLEDLIEIVKWVDEKNGHAGRG